MISSSDRSRPYVLERPTTVATEDAPELPKPFDIGIPLKSLR